MEPDSLIGEVLASRYCIEARVGSGAMGTVYRARHVKLGRPFAVKLLRPSLLGNETIRRRFAREAELAGALHHPNLVSMVDLGETAYGLHYLVMEYADGETLYDLMARIGPMPGDRVTAIVRQLCDGLAHAHGHGLIHRDFKPENVIVGSEHGRDHVKIVDFGIAILRDDAVSSSPDRLTTAGAVVGTPHYMAPEHALGRPIDHRVDLFALGVLCFEMLTGAAPFDGDGVDIARANVMTQTPAMGDRVPGVRVDPLLEAFTRRLMMKSPDARPASAADARALLDLIERDRAAAATALDVAPAAPPGMRRPPTPAPAIAMATERVVSLQGTPVEPLRRPRPALPFQLPVTGPPGLPGLPAAPELPAATVHRVPGLPVEATARVAPLAPAAPLRPRPPMRHRILASLVLAAALAVTLVAALVMLHTRR
ncbi:MAG TPA: protein kinase [Kofleriaceae bacterium]|nr:protein kinase [Kofleriaceae bacterium]